MHSPQSQLFLFYLQHSTTTTIDNVPEHGLLGKLFSNNASGSSPVGEYQMLPNMFVGLFALLSFVVQYRTKPADIFFEMG